MLRGCSEISFDDECLTGGKLQVMEPLIRKVAQYCRGDRNVKKMYIGIASGSDAVAAMKRRYDDYKAEEGLNHMVAIYQSTSQINSREVEGELCEYFQDHGANINRTGGGGGRDSSGPSFYVYLAMRRWG